MIEQLQTEIANLRALSECFELPRDYLIVDIETESFPVARNHIIDVGWAIVKDGKIAQSVSLLLDWRHIPGVDHARIRYELGRQIEAYRNQGRPHYYSWERLCEEGEHPIEVIHSLASIIYEYCANGGYVVGHNAWKFDCPVIERHAKMLLRGYEIPWTTDTLIDSGLLEKFAQTGELIHPGESLMEWWERIAYTRLNGRQVKWSLDKFCVPKYHLSERYGLDPKLSHTAEFDCKVTHSLLDTYQQMTEISLGQKQAFDQGSITHGEASTSSRPEPVPPRDTPPIPGIPTYRRP